MRHLLIACAATALAAITPGIGTAAAQDSAPAKPQDNPSDPVIARRGSVTVTAADVRDMLAAAEPEQRKALLADPQALRRLVRDRLVGEVVLDAAHTKQWDTRPDVVYRAEQAREAAITESYLASLTQPDPAYPSDAEIQDAYDANKARFLLPRQYHLAQIFAAVPNGAGQAVDDAAQKRLGDLRNQVVKQKADFAALARKASDDKVSAQAGGDLGWVREDAVIPALRPVVAALADGALSDPVRTADGWHLLRLLGGRPAAPAPLADAHDVLVRSLRQDKQQQTAQAYLAALLAAQPVEMNEIALSNLGK